MSVEKLQRDTTNSSKNEGHKDKDYEFKANKNNFINKNNDVKYINNNKLLPLRK